MNNIPIININNIDKNECNNLVKSLRDNGIVIIKDDKVNINDNNNFLDMMETYYENHDYSKDIHKELGYQVGLTPELIELPLNHCSKIKELDDNNKPQTICPPELDIKNRFLWRIGERPKNTNYPELNANQVIPDDIPNWEKTMNKWGNKLLNTIEEVISMMEIGLNLETNELKKLLKYGPHLLAPTGSDFNRFNKLNTVLAGYHYDISLLTIHGKSRYAGLFVWLRNGKRLLVKIPDGCLLIQAGKTLEYLTGGYIKAGFHEVIISDETLKTIKKKKEKGESLWRISSTLFSHISSDVLLKPLKNYENEEYKEIISGEFIKNELKKIKLEVKD